MRDVRSAERAELQPEPVDERPSGEHRLALVLNGGVSLAVWMAGVCHEVDLLRRASAGLPIDPRDSAANKKVFHLWETAASLHRKIVVDVIAGTSAGGLNGVFLAAAVARGGSLHGLKDLWMEGAQLDATHLLSARDQLEGTNELLDGAFFRSKIREILKGITPLREADDGAPVRLITTASAAAGPAPRYADSTGRGFQVPDHRRRFVFRRRPATVRFAHGSSNLFPERPAVNDFDAAGPVLEAVVLAARATASIPGVFDPVGERGRLRGQREMPDWDDGSPLEWLLDGGLLDNAPIELLLEAMARQPVTTTWNRTMAYVVPITDVLEDVDAQGANSAIGPDSSPQTLPPPWSVTVPSIIGFPGEVNLRSGIDRLDAVIGSSRPDLDAALFDTLSRSAADRASMLGTAERLFDHYRSLRASNGVTEAIQLGSEGPVRMLRPVEWDGLDAVLATPVAWLPQEFSAFDASGQWRWGVDAADRAVRLMLRSLRETEGSAFDVARAELHARTEELFEVRRILEQQLRQPYPPGASAVQVAQVVGAVYDDLGIGAALATVVNGAAATCSEARIAEDADFANPAGVIDAALCMEVITGASGFPVDYHPTPSFDFARFDVDVPTDVIDVVLAGRRTSDLLYGSRLGHFAAFGREEWRQWDWMWGRISGALHLCRQIDATDDQRRDLVQAIITAEGTDVASVTTHAQALLDGTIASTGDVLGQLLDQGTGALAVDALLHVAAGAAETDPVVPSQVAVAGRVLNAALRRRGRWQFPDPSVAPVGIVRQRFARFTWRIVQRVTGWGTAPTPPPGDTLPASSATTAVPSTASEAPPTGVPQFGLVRRLATIVRLPFWGWIGR